MENILHYSYKYRKIWGLFYSFTGIKVNVKYKILCYSKEIWDQI